MPKDAEPNLPDFDDPWQKKWFDLKVTHPDFQAAVNDLTEFLWKWYSFNKQIRRCVMFGGNGNGKTTLLKKSYHWARAINLQRYFTRGGLANMPGPSFARWQSVCDELNTDQSFAYLDELADSSILFLDDVGAEADRFKNKHSTDALCYLLSICQDRTPLVMTTNEAPSNWATRWDTRTEDRLLRNCVFISFENVPSWSRP